MHLRPISTYAEHGLLAVLIGISHKWSVLLPARTTPIFYFYIQLATLSIYSYFGFHWLLMNISSFLVSNFTATLAAGICNYNAHDWKKLSFKIHGSFLETLVVLKYM